MMWQFVVGCVPKPSDTLGATPAETSTESEASETPTRSETGDSPTGETASGTGETEVPPEAPTADLVVTPIYGEVPLTVTFDASASTAEGDLASSIDFGDGTVIEGITGSHTYLEVGAWLVHLAVTDSFGQEAHDYAAVASVPATCPTGDEPVLRGTLDHDDLDEASGLAASRTYADVFWSHNDSGGDPTLFAIGGDGRILGGFDVTGATLTDWEDLDIGADPASGVPRIYVGDVGDNSRVRTEVTVWIVEEPFVDASWKRTDGKTSPALEITLVYPEGPEDSEAIFVDPRTDDLYLVTKDRDFSGFTGVFRKAAPHVDGEVATLELVTSFDVWDPPYAGMLTSATASPDGSKFALRGYGLQAFVYLRADTMFDTFSTVPCLVDLPESDGLAEAIAFGTDGDRLFTLNEGEGSELWEIPFL